MALPREHVRKDAARRIAAGEPVPNVEVLSGVEGAFSQLEQMKKSGQLNPEGVQLADDSQRVLHAGGRLIAENNRGEELQKIHAAIKFIHDRMASQSDEAQRDSLGAKQAYQVMDHLRSIAESMVSSPGFRKELRKLNALMLKMLSSYSAEKAQKLQEGTEEKRERVEGEKKTAEGQERLIRRKGEVGATPTEEQLEEGRGERRQTREKESTGRNTEHTREDYKLIISGREYSFLDTELEDEQLDNIVKSLQNTCVDISGDEQVSNSILETIQFVSELQVKLSKKFSQLDDREIEDAVNSIVENAKVVVSRFASDHDMDMLDRSFSKLAETTLNDQALQQDWKSMLNFFQRSLQEKGFVKRDSWPLEAKEEIVRVRHHLFEYRHPLFELLQEIDSFLTDLREDTGLKYFSGTTRQLTQDLFCDNQGRLAFKLGALMEFKNILVPVISEQVKYVAVPDLKGSDKDLTYELSNTLLQTRDILPDMVSVWNSNHLRVSGKTDYANAVASLYVCIKGVRMAADDLHLKYKRHSFPAISDEGTLNAEINGGMDLEMWLSGDALDDRVFHVDDVNCDISGLNLNNLQFRNHEFLYHFFKPLLQFMVRRKIEKNIEEKLKTTLISLDDAALKRLQSTA